MKNTKLVAGLMSAIISSTALAANTTYSVTGSIDNIRTVNNLAASIAVGGPSNDLQLYATGLSVVVSGSVVLDENKNIISMALTQNGVAAGPLASPTYSADIFSLSGLSWIYASNGATNGGAALLQQPGAVATCGPLFSIVCTAVRDGINSPTVFGGVNYSNSNFSFDGYNGTSEQWLNISYQPVTPPATDGIVPVSNTVTVGVGGSAIYELYNWADGGTGLVFDAISQSTLTLTLVADADLDGIADSADNCPAVANPDQLDLNNNDVGDACEGPDGDLDGVPDDSDNCPLAPNPDQRDTDGDLSGDACDLDTDGDGVANELDNCPLIVNPGQEDNDGDSLGNACDGTPNGVDTDGDSIADIYDNCPLVANRDQSDKDGDGLGDVCDTDSDNDGIPDAEDLFPFNAAVPEEFAGKSTDKLKISGCKSSTVVSPSASISFVSDAYSLALGNQLTLSGPAAGFLDAKKYNLTLDESSRANLETALQQRVASSCVIDSLQTLSYTLATKKKSKEITAKFRVVAMVTDKKGKTKRKLGTYVIKASVK